jgi:hypothetical protein
VPSSAGIESLRLYSVERYGMPSGMSAAAPPSGAEADMAADWRVEESDALADDGSIGKSPLDNDLLPLPQAPPTRAIPRDRPRSNRVRITRVSTAQADPLVPRPSRKQRLDELVGVEIDQIVHTLSQPDELDG